MPPRNREFDEWLDAAEDLLQRPALADKSEAVGKVLGALRALNERLESLTLATEQLSETLSRVQIEESGDE